jgi:hypothetical protein
MLNGHHNIDNLLWNLLRGTIKSVPLVGALLEQFFFGSLDDHAQAQEAAKLEEVLRELHGQSRTLEEIARLVKEQVHLSPEDAIKLNELIDLSSAAGQGDSIPISPQVRQAFLASVERRPLNAYLADLTADLKLWRGLGLPRPISIEDIFVPINLSSEQSFSETVVPEDLLRKLSGDHNLLVEGPPGSGKSTLLRHWALNLAERAIKSSTEYIPIFLALSFVELSCDAAHVWDLPIPDLVARRFPTPLGRLSETLLASISQKMDSGHIVILLDGFDEVSEPNRPNMLSWINRVCNTARGSLIVVASRPIHYVNGLSPFCSYGVQPFSRDQQNILISRWFESKGYPNEAKKMQNYLDREDRFLVRKDQAIVGNPLFLTMMCIEFELTGKLSRTPGQLVAQFTKILLWDWHLQKGLGSLLFQLDVKQRVLESVASFFFEAQRSRFSLGELLDCVRSVLTDLDEHVNPEKLIREIESTSGLITEDRYGDWQFSHFLFQEFFTARYRWRCSLRGLDQKEWFDKANWKEPERYQRVMDFYQQLGENGPR